MTATLAWLVVLPAPPALAWSSAAPPANCAGLPSELAEAEGCLSAESASPLLLPDLLTLPPHDLKIVTLPDGARELRLSNTVWNTGDGPLELEGAYNLDTEKTRVEQHVYAADGVKTTSLVGEFIWHVNHDHWHFEQFSIYELWTLTPDGSLGALVSSSDKVSYCVIDTDVIDNEMDGFSRYRRYVGCGQTLQGLSIGWGDTYKSHLDGQSIHLEGVEDGFYALRSTANPDAILLESDYDNNAALFYLAIRGEEIAVLGLLGYIRLTCQEAGWWTRLGAECRI